VFLPDQKNAPNIYGVQGMHKFSLEKIQEARQRLYKSRSDGNEKYYRHLFINQFEMLSWQYARFLQQDYSNNTTLNATWSKTEDEEIKRIGYEASFKRKYELQPRIDEITNN
jgi:predicted RNA-binding protein